MTSLLLSWNGVRAQEKLLPPPVVATTNLESLLVMANEKQPALAAARASLAAAYSGQQGLNDLRFARLFAPDINIRKQQACLGVTIANASLLQAEYETRYAVIRTFYSVQYARMQKKSIDNVLEKIGFAHEKAKKVVDIGDPKIKVTAIDRDSLGLYYELVKTKQVEAESGIQRAFAGLREAIGVNLDCPIDFPYEPLPAAFETLDKEALIALALAQRGEMQQAYAASQVTNLEICAQQKYWFRPTTKTFAAGSDIHAKPIPQGVSNGEYRPGAIGLEMPPFLVGPRRDRVQRASDLNARASAVVDKTHNLITLEVEAYYLKWKEASDKARILASAPAKAKEIAEKVQNRFGDEGGSTGEEVLRARTLEDQTQVQYNEALFNHLLALAALERATAGGYRTK